MTDASSRAAESPAAAARSLARMLVQAAEDTKAAFHSAAAAVDLSVPAARALLLLDTPAPMSELAERLTCDRSYITSITDQLETKALVVRVPGADRRVKLLQLTDTGVEIRKQLEALVADSSSIVHRLCEDDRITLQRLLDLLLEPR